MAGFKYATVGVFYAIFLTFTILDLWEEFRDAKIAVRHEAGILDALYHLSSGMPENIRNDVQAGLYTYAETVVTDEWLTMARGHLSLAARGALNNVFAIYMSIEPPTEREARLLDVSFGLLAELTENRRERHHRAAGAIPGLMWFAMIIGALVVVGFTFFFGSPNMKAQIAMSGLVSLSVMMLIVLAVALHHPFTGDVSVSSEPIERVIELMEALSPDVAN